MKSRILLAAAALAFVASAQEAQNEPEPPAQAPQEREVRLAVCAFGTAETMTPIEDWLGKTIHPGQYAAGLPSLPQLGENKEHNAGSVEIAWSSRKLEVTSETDMIQAENQRNRKLLNDIRLKVLNDPSRRYVPLAVGYLESALFSASKGAVKMVDLEKADVATRLITVSLGDREEQCAPACLPMPPKRSWKKLEKPPPPVNPLKSKPSKGCPPPHCAPP